MGHETGEVALLTDRRYEANQAAPDDWYLRNILDDDRLLQASLRELGLKSVRVDWARPDVEWSRFQCAVFRTTWDYFDRYQEFQNWLARVQGLTRLCNPLGTVRWNADKHYLSDLEKQGIRAVPSYFIERGNTRPLEDLLAETGWSEAVIKPAVSGAARHTYRVQAGNLDNVKPIVQQLLQVESLILQPFLSHIIEHGEDTLMVFDGRYTHAVRKRAKPGDFRVQDDHGGTVESYTPSAEQIKFAEQAMAACHPLPTYGRVDMARDLNGDWAVMELELIEPELWLRLYPPAARAFAAAIAKQL